MWSPEVIRQLSDKAAKESAAKKKVPYVIWNEEEIDRYPPFPFPALGSRVPKGWKLLDEPAPLFCDMTGFGGSGEPALTTEQTMERLHELFTENPKYGYAIIEYGQFQCHVGVFLKQVKRRKSGDKNSGS